MFDTSQVHLGMSRNRISAVVNGMLQRFNDLLRALANLVRHAQVTGHSNTLALAVSAVLAQGEGASVRYVRGSVAATDRSESRRITSTLDSPSATLLAFQVSFEVSFFQSIVSWISF